MKHPENFIIKMMVNIDSHTEESFLKEKINNL